MNDPDTRKAIKDAVDACRPGADDTSLPEMSALAEILRDDEQVRRWYDRTQRTDAAVGRAFRDVPVPEGLSERLLDAVQKASYESAEESPSFIHEVVTEDTNADSADGVAVPASRRKRWKRVAMIGVSVAAIVMVCVALLRPGSQEIVSGELPDELKEWIWATAPASDWSGNVREAPVRDNTHDAAIRGAALRWCIAKTRYDSETVVYDVSRPGGGRSAYVFCIRTGGRSVALPNVLPPQWTTGGVAVGAWLRGGMLYVLAVKGGEREYQNYVGPQVIS